MQSALPVRVERSGDARRPGGKRFARRARAITGGEGFFHGVELRILAAVCAARGGGTRGRALDARKAPAEHADEQRERRIRSLPELERAALRPAESHPAREIG